MTPTPPPFPPRSPDDMPNPDDDFFLDEAAGADEPLLFLAEDEVTASEARAARIEAATFAANDADTGASDVDAAPDSVIEKVIEEAAELAMATGEPVFAVVDGAVVAVAVPSNTDADAEMTETAADLPPFAAGEVVDELPFIAEQPAANDQQPAHGNVGESAPDHAAPVMGEEMLDLVDEDEDEDTDDARAGEMATDPAPVMGEEMRDIVEQQPAARSPQPAVSDAAGTRRVGMLSSEELATARVNTDAGFVSVHEADSMSGAAPAPIVPPAAPAPHREGRVWHDVSLLTADDLYLFGEGTHTRLYDKLGAHPMVVDGIAGTHFAVWAPNARIVSVVGEFNNWFGMGYDLAPVGSAGIWGGFLPGVMPGTSYKYHIVSQFNGYEVDKADPFAIYDEPPPHTASVVWDAAYEWHDGDWMRDRAARNAAKAPVSTYEMHIGSWRRVPEDSNRPLTYRELAPQLADYLRECGFTHVEFLPVMEHPFGGSWGYQVTGYFVPTSRFGTPQDFAYLVDYLHQQGIGVILDWVPSHFPTDQFGLDYFDGTHLYEHADPRQGFHPDWKSDVFNYGRNEVRSFLMSSAIFWLDRFHADGLRVDGVASMLYLDYSRNPGEWVPNRFGGRENLEAVSLLKQLNTHTYGEFPDTQTIAEESTSWPLVSRPTYIGGLGFGMKWDMGWMHDTLEYMALDPVYRQFHHNSLTFRQIYSFAENFVLPLSHDEVVYGKGSLIRKMAGDDWQKFANLRLLFGYQWAQSGKKLLFMGGEFAQWSEWNHDTSLDWHLLDAPQHRGVQAWVRDLNGMYRSIPALHEGDFDGGGFEWINANDSAQSVVTFIRRGDDREDPIIVAANFTPMPRHNYRLGVPFGGFWSEILNSDAPIYGGSGQGNMGGVEAVPVPAYNHAHSLTVTVPPLGIVFFRRAYGS